MDWPQLPLITLIALPFAGSLHLGHNGHKSGVQSGRESDEGGQLGTGLWHFGRRCRRVDGRRSRVDLAGGEDNGGDREQCGVAQPERALESERDKTVPTTPCNPIGNRCPTTYSHRRCAA